MRFFIAIIVIALFVFKPKWIAVFQKQAFLSKWWALLDQRLSTSIPKVLMLLIYLIPVILISAVLLPYLEGKYFALLYLLFSVALLAFSLGDGNVVEQYNAYIKEWKSGTAKEMLDIFKIDKEQIKDDKDIHQAARSGFIYAAFEQLFCVVFWFVLFGLMMPLFYCFLKQIKNSAFLNVKKNGDLDEVASVQLNVFIKYVINFIEYIPAILVSVALDFVANKKIKGFKAILVNFSHPGVLVQSSLDTTAQVVLGFKTGSELQALDLYNDQQRAEFYALVIDELTLLKDSFKYLFVLFFVGAALWMSVLSYMH